MVEQYVRYDRLVTKALRRENTPWPKHWRGPEFEAGVIERTLYHGVAALLFEWSYCLIDWPDEIIARLREQALGQTMWEIRHKLVLTELLTCLANDDINAIILKGTAFAYDIYSVPATRTRADTDILIAQEDLSRTRARLQKLGFRLAADTRSSSDFRLQEVWHVMSADQSKHEIDLHWQAMNSPVLQGTFTVTDCLAAPLPLPRLCDTAHTMDRASGMMYACLHRAKHIVSPYAVDGVTYYGGDRLIWAYDLHLLATTLSPRDWAGLCEMAIDRELADICLDGLTTAQVRLGTRIPEEVIERLKSAPGSKVSTYLLKSGQIRRAWMDFCAVPGLRRRARYLIDRFLPSAPFMRAKYPDMHTQPLALLYLRRFLEFMRNRFALRHD